MNSKFNYFVYAIFVAVIASSSNSAFAEEKKSLDKSNKEQVSQNKTDDSSAPKLVLAAKPYTSPAYVFANYRKGSEVLEGPRKLKVYLKDKKILIKTIFEADKFTDDITQDNQEVDVALIQISPTRQLLLRAILTRKEGSYWVLADAQSKKQLYQSGNNFWATGELHLDGDGKIHTLQSNELWCGRVWLEQAHYQSGKISVLPTSLALINEESTVSAKTLPVFAGKSGKDLLMTLKQDNTLLVLGEDALTVGTLPGKTHRFLVKTPKGYIGWVSAQNTLSEFPGCKVPKLPD